MQVALPPKRNKNNQSAETLMEPAHNEYGINNDRRGVDHSSGGSREQPRSERQIYNSSSDAAIYGLNPDATAESRALVPYRQPASQKGSKSRTRVRAN